MRVFGLLRVADEGLGDVDPGHAGAALGKQPRVVPFPAANVEAGQALDIRKHLEEGRGVQAVAIMVVAGAHQLRPCLGILVPVAANLFMVHRTMLQCFPAGLLREQS